MAAPMGNNARRARFLRYKVTVERLKGWREAERGRFQPVGPIATSRVGWDGAKSEVRTVPARSTLRRRRAVSPRRARGNVKVGSPARPAGQGLRDGLETHRKTAPALKTRRVLGMQQHISARLGPGPPLVRLAPMDGSLRSRGTRPAAQNRGIGRFCGTAGSTSTGRKSERFCTADIRLQVVSGAIEPRPTRYGR